MKQFEIPEIRVEPYNVADILLTSEQPEEETGYPDFTTAEDILTEFPED